MGSIFYHRIKDNQLFARQGLTMEIYAVTRMVAHVVLGQHVVRIKSVKKSVRSEAVEISS